MLRVADRELEDVGETPRAEVPQEEQPTSERAGDAGGEDPRARDQLVAELVKALDRRGRRRDSLPAQRERLAALGGPEHGRNLAARSVQVRLDDLQHEPRRDGRIEGVAPALEHRHTRLRRKPVGRRDHPEGAAQLGTRRERHVRSLRKPSRPAGRSPRSWMHHEVRVERIVLEQVHVDRREARLGKKLAGLLLSPHRTETVAALRQRDRHAVHARDHVEERRARMIEVLVDMTRPLDVLHEIDALGRSVRRMPFSSASGFAWSCTASKVVT